jgi:hypothetical protein
VDCGSGEETPAALTPPESRRFVWGAGLRLAPPPRSPLAATLPDLVLVGPLDRECPEPALQIGGTRDLAVAEADVIVASVHPVEVDVSPVEPWAVRVRVYPRRLRSIHL